MSEKEMLLDIELIFPVISGKVSMAINRMMYRNFRKEDLDITPEQWTVLAFLWKEDGITQQRLCDVTFKDKPSMTRLIDNLVKQKLVKRKASANDRRSNLIYLTEEGRGIKEKAMSAVQKTLDTALAGIDDQGMDYVRNILKIVFSNIQESLGKS